MNRLSERDVWFWEDLPLETALECRSSLAAGGGLVHLATHTGTPPALCDVLMLGTPGALAIELEQRRIRQPKEPDGFFGCHLATGSRSRVIGSIPLGPDTDTEEALWIAELALASGADMLEVEVVDPEHDRGSLLETVVHTLTQRRVPIFVQTRSSTDVSRAVQAGACAVTVTDHRLLPDLVGVRCGVILRRSEPLFGADQMGIGFQVMASLSRNLSAAKDAGLARGQLMVDPVIETDLKTVHAGMINRQLRLIARLGYPVVAGPVRRPGTVDRLFLLADAQLRCVYGGAGFIRARGSVEISQALALADRLPSIVA